MESNWIDRYTPVKLHFTSCSISETHNSAEPPIILVHGLFATSTTWNRIKCQISNRTRKKVYSIDLRNHGNSEYSDEFTTNHMVSDLIQFMADNNISRAIIVSHSIGGRIAMQLALQRPELVEKLVVEDISITDVHDDLRQGMVALAKNMFRLISQLGPSMRETDAHKMMNSIISKFAPKLGMSQQIEKSMPFYKDENSGEFKFLCNMPAIIELLENLHRTHVDVSGDPIYSGKTLFIKGEHSVFPIEDDRELILKHFPKTEIITITKGHHVSHTECPEEFSRIVSNFILS